MNRENSNISVIGTEIKFALTLSLPVPFMMDDVDFRAKFYIYSDRVGVIKKAEMLRDDKNTYNCVLNTQSIGYGGRIKCQVEVDLPDNACPDGIRTEIIKLETDQLIINGVR
ncbi:MAG: hypothetical protein LUD46_20460 [Parabacteroides sp.]|nr:hypothetical protein [Parabacteroides sp.]